MASECKPIFTEDRGAVAETSLYYFLKIYDDDHISGKAQSERMRSFPLIQTHVDGGEKKSSSIYSAKQEKEKVLVRDGRPRFRDWKSRKI